MRSFFPALFAVLLIASFASAEPVAKIGDREISRQELEDSVRAQLIQIENSRYEILESGLDEMIKRELLTREAAARGISLDELREQEIDSKLSDPGEEEIQRIYDENQARLEGQTLDQVKEMIVSYVKQRDAQNLSNALFESLRSKYGVSVMLEPPVFKVSLGRHPSRGGGETAPVTIVGFSDYECPYCRVAETTVERVLDTYGEKVRYFHRDYPLPFHANAKSASQAASCADDQGKFWEYHKALFGRDSLSVEVFQEIADQLELDRVAFDECLAGEIHSDGIQADILEGGSLGVDGTPAFFVNGRLLSGAQPFEAFKKVIDSEIAKAGGA